MSQSQMITPFFSYLGRSDVFPTLPGHFLPGILTEKGWITEPSSLQAKDAPLEDFLVSQSPKSESSKLAFLIEPALHVKNSSDSDFHVFCIMLAEETEKMSEQRKKIFQQYCVDGENLVQCIKQGQTTYVAAADHKIYRNKTHGLGHIGLCTFNEKENATWVEDENSLLRLCDMKIEVLTAKLIPLSLEKYKLISQKFKENNLWSERQRLKEHNTLDAYQKWLNEKKQSLIPWQVKAAQVTAVEESLSSTEKEKMLERRDSTLVGLPGINPQRDSLFQT